jgi:hypothetical protein
MDWTFWTRAKSMKSIKQPEVLTTKILITNWSRKLHNPLKTSVVDPNPNGSEPGSVLGMRIRIQKHENRPKLTKKPDFQPFKKAFVPTRYVGMFYEHTGFALVWLPGSGSSFRKKPGSCPHCDQCGSTTLLKTWTMSLKIVILILLRQELYIKTVYKAQGHNLNIRS